jgi:NTE family protein
VQRLGTVSTRGAVTIVHFTNRHNTRSLDFKDYEFSRATMTDLWEGGYNDVRRSITNPERYSVTELAEGIRVFDLTASKEPKA